jgi:hypothetical protein
MFCCFFFCTVSPAGAVAGLTTAPAPVGNTQPTGLALRRDARNYISPTLSSTPEQPAPLLAVPSSGKVLRFKLMPLLVVLDFAFFFYPTGVLLLLSVKLTFRKKYTEGEHKGLKRIFLSEIVRS